MFGEIDEFESFFAFPSDKRFNIIHQPISTIDIYSASPLHSYTCVFRWFNLLIYHLQSREYRWSPTSAHIKKSMVFVRRIVQEQTGLQIDQPDPRRGPISTGNIAIRAFSEESKFIECVLDLIEVQHDELFIELTLNSQLYLEFSILIGRST